MNTELASEKQIEFIKSLCQQILDRTSKTDDEADTREIIYQTLEGLKATTKAQATIIIDALKNSHNCEALADRLLDDAKTAKAFGYRVVNYLEALVSVHESTDKPETMTDLEYAHITYPAVMTAFHSLNRQRRATQTKLGKMISKK